MILDFLQAGFTPPPLGGDSLRWEPSWRSRGFSKKEKRGEGGSAEEGLDSAGSAGAVRGSGSKEHSRSWGLEGVSRRGGGSWAAEEVPLGDGLARVEGECCLRKVVCGDHILACSAGHAASTRVSVDGAGNDCQPPFHFVIPRVPGGFFISILPVSFWGSKGEIASNIASGVHFQCVPHTIL